MGDTLAEDNRVREWPKEGVSGIPFWVYTDPEVYRRQHKGIFGGKSWNYMGLVAEVLDPGAIIVRNTRRFPFTSHPPARIRISSASSPKGSIQDSAHRRTSRPNLRSAAPGARRACPDILRTALKNPCSIPTAAKTNQRRSHQFLPTGFDRRPGPKSPNPVAFMKYPG